MSDIKQIVASLRRFQVALDEGRIGLQRGDFISRTDGIDMLTKLPTRSDQCAVCALGWLLLDLHYSGEVKAFTASILNWYRSRGTLDEYWAHIEIFEALHSLGLAGRLRPAIARANDKFDMKPGQIADIIADCADLREAGERLAGIGSNE